MSAYVFIELPAPLNEWIDTPETMFPVRASEAEALQVRDEPQPERTLYELERYLEEYPDRQPRFARAGAQLAFRTAAELFTNGLKEDSLPFYELSLRLNTDDLLARLNYAVALHSLCYRDAALEQYYELMRRTTPQENLRIWILAAQIHLYHQEFEDVASLLDPLAREMFPEEQEFWDLLGEARSAIKERAAPTCPACGQLVPAGMRFCGFCGGKLS
jgi:predicted Zn-dependent protease